MPGKIANPHTDIDAWMGQELTALVQVFMDQQTTIEREYSYGQPLYSVSS